MIEPSGAHDDELVELGRRVESLTLEPGSIKAPLTRLLSPILYRVGWRPKVRVAAIEALVAAVAAISGGGAPGVTPESPARLRATLLPAAIGELRDNLVQVERATVITERPLITYAAWLGRLHALVVDAGRALAREDDPAAYALVALVDPARLLPPLSMRHADARARVDPQLRAAQERDPTRVLELQLDTVDHLLAAAREEDARLGRRRQLLAAARQLLLESSAALDLDEDGVQRRLQSIARQMTRINRYEAAGLSPDVALLHQARAALSRGERDRLFAALSVLRRSAIDRGDVDAAGLTTAAIDRLVGPRARGGLAAASIARSAEEVFGERFARAIEEGYARGRAIDRDEHDESLHEYTLDALREYYAPGQERAALASALAVDGCFEVGGALSPVRVHEQHLRRRVVPYPTQSMKLEQATGPEDLPSALITDPRAIILDLAAGRLLTRRYLEDDLVTRPRTAMQGEVRVYVLDGSSSMIGARARMRDAILMAELATLMKRLEQPQGGARVVLYYRYFTLELSETRRVDSVAGAVEAIRDVAGTVRTGGTNIQRALVASVRMIQEARADDPELACGQIVLVTDGDARVSEERVNEARAELEGVPIGVSVIALGEENRALRRLVANQRAQGERAFYHFLPDDYLRRVVAGDIDDELVVHAGRRPRASEPRDAMPRALVDELDALVEQLGDLQRSREAAARRELDRGGDEPPLEDLELAGEGERARLEALYRDERAVQRRFARWFPPPAPEDAAHKHLSPQVDTVERDDLDALVVLLATTAEVIDAVGSSALGRMADAVELLGRLLPNARLTPARYHELLRLYPRELAEPLRAVHDAARSGLARHFDALTEALPSPLARE